MKALTVRQPWAWAIIHGGKNVENRNWAPRCDAPERHNRRTCGYTPGCIAIHAGLGWSVEGARSHPVWAALEEQGWPTGPSALRRDPRGLLTFGAIIGTVEVIDCHQPSHGLLQVNPCEHHGCDTWGQDVSSHWVLANPQPCQPIPFSGALGLWTLPDDIALRIAP